MILHPASCLIDTCDPVAEHNMWLGFKNLEMWRELRHIEHIVNPTLDMSKKDSIMNMISKNRYQITHFIELIKDDKEKCTDQDIIKDSDIFLKSLESLDIEFQRVENYLRI
ncbi:MAG: hypothetical protein R1F52_06005 [Candidatus Nitrosoabyssus spongiisocia]|nr:MAG: hypothetical protein R1F52_06005 [Nitrosopumilaceae archaeon AB1(1)]